MSGVSLLQHKGRLQVAVRMHL